MAVEALPFLVSSASRNRVAFGVEGSRNYCAFWHAIAAYYVDEQIANKKTLQRITLGNLFNEVDQRMYGYGRSPIFRQQKVVGWRIDQPDLIQDPAFFIPLRRKDIEELRQVLELPEDVKLPQLLDIGKLDRQMPGAIVVTCRFGTRGLAWRPPT